MRSIVQRLPTARKTNGAPVHGLVWNRVVKWASAGSGSPLLGKPEAPGGRPWRGGCRLWMVGRTRSPARVRRQMPWPVAGGVPVIGTVQRLVDDIGWKRVAVVPRRRWFDRSLRGDGPSPIESLQLAVDGVLLCRPFRGGRDVELQGTNVGSRAGRRFVPEMDNSGLVHPPVDLVGALGG